ncbi:hypothetical protein CEXT_83421 [Caerostris extrusa]|uniref:Uncharacterized protein n=1 Tax=Caerostris extrusa TaxID=172846 RepID=A0AAV4M5Y0_CAEEX|nr:hypothetical protein CEXT_83421 [Caerostris extrusa]
MQSRAIVRCRVEQTIPAHQCGLSTVFDLLPVFFVPSITPISQMSSTFSRLVLWARQSPPELFAARSRIQYS